MYGLIFHGNLQYAEIPKSEINTVIKKSYIPTIKKLLKSDIPFGLNITGFSVQFIPRSLIDLIKEGIECDLIELTGTSYTHAILPLLPLNRISEQIRKDLEIKERIFDHTPHIFWPPELAYDPILPGILSKFKFNHIFVDGEALIFSKYMNSAIQKIDIPYKRLIKASNGERKYLNYTLGLPKLKKAINYVFGGKVNIVGVEEIKGIPIWQPINITFMLGLGHFPLMNKRKAIKWIRRVKDVILYGTDIEFFGYMPFGGKILKIEDLISTIKMAGWDIALPSNLPFLNKSYYLKTSSWAPDKTLNLWREDEDNQRLNALSTHIDGPYAFLAENSDARGWLPLPERRLDAFKSIYEHWRDKK